VFSPSFILASEKDAEALVVIEQQVGEPKTYGKPLTLDGALEQLRTSQFYFIQIDNAHVGTAALRIRADNSVYFSNIAILPAHRGCGLGRAAMSFLLAKSEKAPRIDLVTHPENGAALRLYTSLGFTVESRQENYFGDGEPRLMLAKTP
jgi:ribosomal protein S18 acetylase RimI-like enzyme